MNRYAIKMIEEMAKVLCNSKCGECEYIPRLCGYKSYCTRLYNAGCRIIGEDELVIKKKEYADLVSSALFIDVDLEIAREVLTTIYNRLRYATFQQTVALKIVKDFAKELGIEIENTTYSEENDND